MPQCQSELVCRLQISVQQPKSIIFINFSLLTISPLKWTFFLNPDLHKLIIFLHVTYCILEKHALSSLRITHTWPRKACSSFTKSSEGKLSDKLLIKITFSPLFLALIQWITIDLQDKPNQCLRNQSLTNKSIGSHCHNFIPWRDKKCSLGI